MLLNTDGHGNVSYTFETAELNKRRVLDYWTPERKAAAVPIDRTAGLCADGGLLAGETEPQLADLSKMPFMAGGKLFFSKDNKNYVASAELICRRNLVHGGTLHPGQDHRSPGRQLHVRALLQRRKLGRKADLQNCCS